jgi:hypothetical protein
MIHQDYLILNHKKYQNFLLISYFIKNPKNYSTQLKIFIIQNQYL